jgi:hypothetical protein
LHAAVIDPKRSQYFLATYGPLLEGGFNRWMQHTRNCVSRRSVADETKTSDLLHGKSESADVGALEER